jgi:hypothetical protein
LSYLARFVKPGGVVGIAGAGLMREIGDSVPDTLAAWWEPGLSCLHSPSWWHSHWKKTGILDVELADSMPEGWRVWLDWQAVVAPKNLVEIRALEADAGNYMGYVRVAGRRRHDAPVDELIQAVPTTYIPQPLLRPSET